MQLVFCQDKKEKRDFSANLLRDGKYSEWTLSLFSPAQFEVFMFLRFPRVFHNFPIESRWQNASVWEEGRWVEPTHTRKAFGLALFSSNPSKRAGVLTPFLFPGEKRTWMPKPALVLVHTRSTYVISSASWGSSLECELCKDRHSDLCWLNELQEQGREGFISRVEKGN